VGAGAGAGVRRGPAPLALAVYGALVAITVGVSLIRGQTPIETPDGEAWVNLPDWSRHLSSVVAGTALAVATVRASRAFVKRFGWAKMLHADLRPAIRDAGDATIWVLGIASGVAEELFFRGLLTPVFGLFLSSLAFGALHRLRGKVGFFWASWAFVMGLLFGVLFLATGSLLGSILAHATINVINLRFLRDTDVEPQKPRRLGGLLTGKN